MGKRPNRRTKKAYTNFSEQNRRYTYDEIGNLASDKGEYIAQIEWTVDRKVKRIIRDSVGMQSAGVTKPDIEYSYNAMRQRVVKIVKPRDAVSKQLKGSLYWQYTYYTYDAGGNVLATYSRSTSPINGSSTQYADKVSLSEHHVYGSERLAIARPSTTLATWTQTFTVCGGDISNCRIPGPGVSVPPAINTYGYKRSRELGYKEFELSNHLGNVITTVSDRKLQLRNCPEVSIEDIGFENEDGDIQRLQYINAEAGIRNAELELTLHAPQSMVYGEYTATEGGYYYWSAEVSGLTTNGGEVYAKAYPYNSTSGLTGAAQRVKQLMGDGIVSLDYRGESGYDRVRFVIELWSGSADATLHVDNWRVGSSPWAYVNPLPTGGPDLLAPGCNTVGNTFGGYFPDVLMHTDYYAGGQAMPGRTWNGSPDKYRYTHNGHEREDELFEGAQSAEYWMYDSRIIRRWERDPLAYEWQSPYVAFNNNPILFADPLGLKGDDKGKGSCKCKPKEGDYRGKGKGDAETLQKYTDGKWQDVATLSTVDVVGERPSWAKQGKEKIKVSGRLGSMPSMGTELEIFVDRRNEESKTVAALQKYRLHFNSSGSKTSASILWGGGDLYYNPYEDPGQAFADAEYEIIGKTIIGPYGSGLGAYSVIAKNKDNSILFEGVFIGVAVGKFGKLGKKVDPNKPVESPDTKLDTKKMEPSKVNQTGPAICNSCSKVWISLHRNDYRSDSILNANGIKTDQQKDSALKNTFHGQYYYNDNMPKRTIFPSK